MSTRTVTDVRISFDYELAWGAWDTTPPSYWRDYVRFANDAAARIIEIHKRLGVPATWAIVGLALEDTAQSPASRAKHGIFSRKDHQQLGELNDCYHDGNSAFTVTSGILKLLQCPEFEIASHTYAHTYSLDATESDLDEDFASQQQVFRKRGLPQPRSIVFPKNQATAEAISKAKAYGFTRIRVNPETLLYRQEKRGHVAGFIIRLLRYADAFLPLNELFPEKAVTDACFTVGDLFFRPDCGLGVLDAIHLWRIKRRISFDIRHGREAHIWTHPHNFGKRIDTSVNNYERLLNYLNELRDRDQIRIKKMYEESEKR
ncbi:polysaccharide deacetylase family protein [Myxococcota bacterium]|nr:polysaccharide deacetylase family protein [Myxococcota bacterium]